MWSLADLGVSADSRHQVPIGCLIFHPAAFIGIGGAVATVLAAPVVTPIIIVAAILGGSVTGLAGFLGIKSAGPRSP
jgi:hypothetical protein